MGEYFSRLARGLVGAAIGAAVSAGAATAQTFNFDADPVGGMPSAWTQAVTGRGQSVWRVTADPTAPSPGNVVIQSGKGTYPIAYLPGTPVRDGAIQVRFRAIAGGEDRAAGLIWRVKDANNYYVVRANALEDNVVLYKTVNGRRVELDIVGRRGGYGEKSPVPPGQWHTLRVEFAGTRFKVIYNGKPLFEVDDATFVEAGAVGLWTKADSVTAFDDFVVERVN